jgi:hypothetical protein
MKNEFDICENAQHKVIHIGLLILPIVLGTHSFSLLNYSLSLPIFSFELFIKLKKWGFFLKTNHEHPQVITIVFILITL